LIRRLPLHDEDPRVVDHSRRVSPETVAPPLHEEDRRDFRAQGQPSWRRSLAIALLAFSSRCRSASGWAEASPPTQVSPSAPISPPPSLRRCPTSSKRHRSTSPLSRSAVAPPPLSLANRRPPLPIPAAQQHNHSSSLPRLPLRPLLFLRRILYFHRIIVKFMKLLRQCPNSFGKFL
jgi:hypothetical protein